MSQLWENDSEIKTLKKALAHAYNHNYVPNLDKPENLAETMRCLGEIYKKLVLRWN